MCTYACTARCTSITHSPIKTNHDHLVSHSSLSLSLSLSLSPSSLFPFSVAIQWSMNQQLKLLWQMLPVNIHCHLLVELSVTVGTEEHVEFDGCGLVLCGTLVVETYLHVHTQHVCVCIVHTRRDEIFNWHASSYTHWFVQQILLIVCYNQSLNRITTTQHKPYMHVHAYMYMYMLCTIRCSPSICKPL